MLYVNLLSANVDNKFEFISTSLSISFILKTPYRFLLFYVYEQTF